MHDPMTVAFEIKWPFSQIKTFPNGDPWIYRETLITIWHVDPELDGSDDSCGWTWRRDKAARDLMDKAEKDGRREYEFMVGEYGYPMTPLELVFSAWHIIGWRFFRRDKLSTSEINAVLLAAMNPTDNLRWSSSEARESEQGMGNLFRTIMRLYLHHHRPWYKHPRWHIHHWKIQVHFLQALKRYLFSRCAKCGQHFPWGYAPISTSWNGSGPRWFRGESHVYHHECHAAIAKSPNDSVTQ